MYVSTGRTAAAMPHPTLVISGGLIIMLASSTHVKMPRQAQNQTSANWSGKDFMTNTEQLLIGIWTYDHAPRTIKSLSSGKADWIVRFPAGLSELELDKFVSISVENNHKVIRQTLSDGSVVISSTSDAQR